MKEGPTLGSMGEIEPCTKEVGPMTHISFDHHKKWTQAAAIDDQGNINREMRVLNDGNSLKGFLKRLPKPLTGVVEAGPTWGWIYDTLSELGLKMIVANPRRRSRGVRCCTATFR